MSGSGSTRGSEESEEESSSDTDETVSTEQSMGTAEVVTGSVCDLVETRLTIGHVSGKTDGDIDNELTVDRVAPVAQVHGSRLRAKGVARRLGSKPLLGRGARVRLRERSRVFRGTPPTSVREGKGSLTREQRVVVGGLVSRGVTIGTRKGYERHWDKWVGFLQTIPEWQRPSNFLEEVGVTSDKIDWLSLFVVHLYNVHGVRDSQRVSAVLSGLRLMWRIRRFDAGFSDHPDLVAAKKGVRPTVVEIRNNEVRKAETRKLPAIVEVMVAMRERLWLDTGVDPPGLYQRAIWVAALIGFDTGVRPSNVRLKDGCSAVDHCILASDLAFNVTTATSSKRLQGGEAVRTELEVGYPESIQGVPRGPVLGLHLGEDETGVYPGCY